MTPPDDLAAELKGLEEELLVPAVRKSTRLTELLADDFIEFGSSGRIYTKSNLVAVPLAEAPVARTTSNFKVTSLAPDFALLTYKIRDPSALRASGPDAAFVGLAKDQRPVANGLPPRDCYRNGPAIPRAPSSRAAPASG
jgi:hypothetical protein